MKKGEFKKKNGFTIIEVSLVLAVAGLIMTMVFIALPQLQRQQRDSRRKDDILSFLETVKKYQTNNRGALPTDWSETGDFQKNYRGDSFVDPDGEKYTLSAKECGHGKGEKCDYTNPSALNHNLYIFTKATCNGSEAWGSSNPRNIAVVYRMEGSGLYCANT